MGMLADAVTWLRSTVCLQVSGTVTSLVTWTFSGDVLLKLQTMPLIT